MSPLSKITLLLLPLSWGCLPVPISAERAADSGHQVATPADTAEADADSGGDTSERPDECGSYEDCVDICPPASLGCDCHEATGQCLPTCTDVDDCPDVGGGELECTPDGFCMHTEPP